MHLNVKITDHGTTDHQHYYRFFV